MPMDRVTCTIRVTGKVQGVFYRAHTVEEALRLGLTGTVRNMPDGSVEVVATGARGKVEHMVAWCRGGPKAARVESIDVRWHEHPAEFDGFRMAG